MNAPIIYIPNWFAAPEAAFEALWHELDWTRFPNVPRREYYSNDHNAVYTYGTPPYARSYVPKPWHSTMSLFRQLLGNVHDMCFINGYENQSDHLGWHADDSPEIDHNASIAIISLGVERDIMFRSNAEPGVTERLRLGNGSLCIMMPGMQLTHMHRIPKAGFQCGERISLTFRKYKKNES